jgi:hypothetical protein
MFCFPNSVTTLWSRWWWWWSNGSDLSSKECYSQGPTLEDAVKKNTSKKRTYNTWILRITCLQDAELLLHTSALTALHYRLVKLEENRHYRPFTDQNTNRGTEHPAVEIQDGDVNSNSGNIGGAELEAVSNLDETAFSDFRLYLVLRSNCQVSFIN